MTVLTRHGFDRSPILVVDSNAPFGPCRVSNDFGTRRGFSESAIQERRRQAELPAEVPPSPCTEESGGSAGLRCGGSCQQESGTFWGHGQADDRGHSESAHTRIPMSLLRQRTLRTVPRVWQTAIGTRPRDPSQRGWSEPRQQSRCMLSSLQRAEVCQALGSFVVSSI